jgi:hypothetical protein
MVIGSLCCCWALLLLKLLLPLELLLLPRCICN